MRPTFFGLEIARTGMMISQKGMDVTGHNISNVDTEGYTRQRLVNTAIDPYHGYTRFQYMERGRVGQGVQVMVLDQIRDPFLDKQFRNHNSETAKWAERTQALSYLEPLYYGTKGNASINVAINSFFQALNVDHINSSDKDLRANLRQEAISLCETFNGVYDQMVEFWSGQNQSIEIVANDINTKLEEVAVLNREIERYELSGEHANDLRDKRNLLLDKISEQIGIRYYDEPTTGRLIVELENTGEQLVNHRTVTPIEIEYETNPYTGEDDHVKLTLNGMDINISNISTGRLFAHMNLRDNETAINPGFPYFIEQVNVLARSLAKAINEIHAQGYTDPRDASGVSQTGIDFFYNGVSDALDGDYTIAVDDTDPANVIFTATDPLSGKEYTATLDMTTPIAAGDEFTLDFGEFKMTATADVAIDDTNAATVLGGTEFNITMYTASITTSMPGVSGVSVEADPYAALNAGNFRISDEILASEFNIASSAYYVDLDIPNNYAGNQENVALMFELLNKNNIPGVGGFESYYSSMVADLAVILGYSKNMTQTQAILLDSVENSRLSISSVSLDEEMTNLIRFNHAYGGASRVITAMDEALETLINKMGIVGR